MLAAIAPIAGAIAAGDRAAVPAHAVAAPNPAVDFHGAKALFVGQARSARAPTGEEQRIGGVSAVATVGQGWHKGPRVLVHEGSSTPGNGDLIAAQRDANGVLWFDRVLCRSGHAFEACAQKYARGVFDADSGRQLDAAHRLLPQGEWIDVTTYVRLSKDPERHKASELDPRALNRCDDCKGSVPGSVRAVVPVPQLDNRQ